jgi:hypothetical protein
MDVAAKQALFTMARREMQWCGLALHAATRRVGDILCAFLSGANGKFLSADGKSSLPVARWSLCLCLKNHVDSLRFWF